MPREKSNKEYPSKIVDLSGKSETRKGLHKRPKANNPHYHKLVRNETEICKPKETKLKKPEESEKDDIHLKDSNLQYCTRNDLDEFFNTANVKVQPPTFSSLSKEKDIGDDITYAPSRRELASILDSTLNSNKEQDLYELQVMSSVWREKERQYPTPAILKPLTTIQPRPISMIKPSSPGDSPKPWQTFPESSSSKA